MERKCLDCGEKIIGRSDKKFCSDSCRNNYNYHLNNNRTNFVRKIDNVLKKNRRVLAQLNPKGKNKVSRDKLLENGFNFGYHTNIYKTKTGNTYYFVYEQGYLALENNLFALVVKGDYL